MMRIRPVCGILALAACLGLLAGCWDKAEIDDLAMVMGSGLDLTEDGKLEATAQIASPTGIPTPGGGAAAKKPVVVVSETGIDGLDVMNRMQERLSKKFFLGHRSVLIIGEKYARHGVDQVLSQLMRSPDSRYSSYILTTYGSSAKKILNTPYELELIPAFAIKKMQKDGNTLGIRLDEFLDALATGGKPVITGAIRIVNSGKSGTPVSIDMAAVYRDNKLAGYLKEEEMKILLWTKGKLEGSFMSAKVEPKTKMFKGTVGVSILKSGAKIRSQIIDGKPHVTLTLEAKAAVQGNDTELDLSKEKNIKHVEHKLSEHTKKTVDKMLRRAQKNFKVDIFDFGAHIHFQHPYFWKTNKDQWERLFPRVPVTVKVDYQIERTGRTQGPAPQKK